MRLLLAYSLRNLRTRKITTALTAGGMALVLFVFAAVLMLDSGLKQTLVSTGEDANAIFVRRSAEVEIQSMVDRRQAGIIESQPEVLLGSDGAPVVSKEVVVLIALPRQGSGQTSNIVTRGVGAAVLTLRPKIHIAKGRMFRPGSNEIMIGGAPITESFRVAIGAERRVSATPHEGHEQKHQGGHAGHGHARAARPSRRQRR